MRTAGGKTIEVTISEEDEREDVRKVSSRTSSYFRECYLVRVSEIASRALTKP
jgi:hypothetical protein